MGGGGTGGATGGGGGGGAGVGAGVGGSVIICAVVVTEEADNNMYKRGSRVRSKRRGMRMQQQLFLRTAVGT